jgi:hypothetical protein
VRDQVSHPHKTTGKTIVLYTFYIFKKQIGRQKTEQYGSKQLILPINFLVKGILICYHNFKTSELATFSNDLLATVI